MPPRRKAATGSLTKKTKAAQQEQAEVVDIPQTTVAAEDVAGADSVASTSAVRIEATQIGDVKPAKRTTRSVRAAKGKKAAVVADAADAYEAQAEEPTPDAAMKPELSAEADVNSVDDAASLVDQTNSTQRVDDADDPLDGLVGVSQTPDIAGVVEEREDEDLAMDDSEPAPMDAEEAKRLLERPKEARDTSDQPMTHAGAQEMASQTQHEGVAQRNAAIDSGAAPAGVLMEGPDQMVTDISWLQPAPQAGPSMTADDRKAKMAELRKRKNESAQANRKEVISAQNEHRKNIAESKRLERKRKQAEAMGEKLEAMETGEDLERKRNWEYSLEDNERWSEKLAQKQQRMDTGFASYDDSAQRKYTRDTEAFKPDLAAYQAQKAAAYGSAEAAGLVESASSSNGALIQTGGSSSLVSGAEQLYRDANSFIYADHKPSDDAVDRVIGQINQDIDKRMKRSRIRPEEDGDVTYINDRNKVFNKKLERYYSKFTGGIRDNFERGTAL